jgi:hypothetical protein
MKRIVLLATLVLGLFVGKVSAADYDVALTTYVPTASAGDFVLGAYPNIARPAKIKHIILANYGGAADQIVTIYDNATSSTAATTAGKIVIGSSTTVQIPVNGAYDLYKPGFNKSSTSSTVHATIVYE